MLVPARIAEQVAVCAQRLRLVMVFQISNPRTNNKYFWPMPYDHSGSRGSGYFHGYGYGLALLIIMAPLILFRILQSLFYFINR